MTYTLGVFIDDRLIAPVPESDAQGTKPGNSTVGRLAKLLNRPKKDFDVLMVCENHEKIPAVACIACNRESHETV